MQQRSFVVESLTRAFEDFLLRYGESLKQMADYLYHTQMRNRLHVNFRSMRNKEPEVKNMIVIVNVMRKMLVLMHNKLKKY
jgi:hypothetical protein